MPEPCCAKLLRQCLTITATVCLLAGGFACHQESTTSSQPVVESVAAQTPVSAPPTELPTVSENSQTSPRPLLKDTWDSVLLNGGKVGYSHLTAQEVSEDGQTLMEWSNTTALTMKRFGQSATTQITATSVETPAGQVLRFESKINDGQNEQSVSGVYGKQQMRLTTTTLGKSQIVEIPWDTSWGGYFADQQSLERKPMQPGERREITALMPGTAQTALTTLHAVGHESTKLPTGELELLRIDSTVQIAGTTIKSIAWTNEAGQVLKTEAPGLRQESYRTTKEAALGSADASAFDLGEGMIVKVSQPLPTPHATKRVTYRATLASGDPSESFANSPTQLVRRVDEHVAEITVRAIRPETAADTTFPTPAAPTDADLRPNNLIQSDDAEIVKLAQSIAPEETDPAKVAQQFEQHVRGFVHNKNFTQAISSAADVVRSREGDCTEHAVLLAALCRARGIPARVAIGLVYYEPLQGFAYHMWNEVWLAGQWVPLDSTLGQGGIGAAHLKVSDSDLSSASPITALLPVVEVMGQLELEIVAAE